MTEFIKFAFSAGEISPTLMGRTDLEKYDLGLALAKNWFVDYRGGLCTRPGTIFHDYIWKDDKEIRLVPFQFAPDVANSYVIMLGDLYIRFVQDGAYVLEDGTTITGVSQANPGVVTSVGHGLVTGDWVKLTGMVGMRQLSHRSLRVVVLTADTFSLQDPYSTPIDTTGFEAYSSGGEVARIYTISSPYPAEDIDDLHFYQYRDLVRITELHYPPMNLIRNDHADWVLSSAEIGADAGIVTGLTTTPTSSGSNSIAFVVTAVNEEGEESIAHTPVIEDDTKDPFTGDIDYVDLNWDPVDGAKSYNIYASRVQRNNDVTLGAELGFVGRAYTAYFQYSNIIPDFTKTPPEYNNPFSPGAIEHVDITATGSGYVSAPTVTMGGGGTGWTGYAVINKLGEVTSIFTKTTGTGYSSPTVTISGGGGVGATAVATAAPLTGTYPHVSTIFQQRLIYASTENKPLTIWGSKPKMFDNFDVSQVVLDNDSYEFELDAQEVTPIKFLKPVRGGLLVFTDAGIWLLTGGGLNDPVTPTNVLAQPNTFKGIADVPPLGLDTDILYIESRGYTARLLSFNDVTRVYAGEDISIFSNHFFGSENFITEWTYADDPHKLVWARRQDGSLVSLTAVKEQKLFAWTQHWTKGLFERVLTIREGVSDRAYLVVQRYVGNRLVKYLESFSSRRFGALEEAFCVDSGLSLGRTYPDATLVVFERTELGMSIAAIPAIFSVADEGKILRAAGGKFRVENVPSATWAECVILREPTALIPEDESGGIRRAFSGEWSLDTPVDSVGGLWHLEGQEVSALVDGNVVQGCVVTNGEVTLPFAGSMIHIGLPYSCKAKTLPLTSQQGLVESKRMSVKGIVGRFYETAGLRFGTDPDKVKYEIPVRVNEILGEPTEPLTGKKQVMLPPNLDEDGELYIYQDYPLPASLLGFVTDVELGDDEG